jgi:hypothetical protein
VRRLALIAVAVVAAGCASSNHRSGVFANTTARGDAPAGGRAGGPPTLAVHGREVVAKGLLVVRATGSTVVVRRPHGGTLTLAGSHAAVRKGEHVSFRGLRRGSTVRVSTLSVSR